MTGRVNDIDSPTLARPAVSADRTAFIAATIIFAVLSTWLAQASKGFLEADGVTHYLYARYAFDNPAYMLDVWARPMRMLLHAVPAHYFGLRGVRAASLVAAIATAWVTYAIARKLGWSRPALAGLFVLAQPLFFLHSFSELTEVPFALLAATAMLSLVTRRWWAFALACGLTPAARPEGAAFVLLAIGVLTLHRRWLCLPLAILPLLVWNHLGWWMWGSDSGPWHRWLIDHFPYSSDSVYKPGPIYRYLAVLPTVVSPLILPAVILGTFGLRSWHNTDRVHDTPLWKQWVLPDEWLIACIAWGFLAIHSLLHFYAKMSSSGEPRYLLAASPFWALLACRGWSMLADRFAWRRPILLASLAAMLPIAVNVGYRVVPLREQPDALLCKSIGDWYAAAPWHDAYPHVYATHPLVYFYLNQKLESATRDFIDKPPPGVMFVYDSMYGWSNSDPRRLIDPKTFEAAGWKVAPGSEGFGMPTQTWRIYLSPEPLASEPTN
jgi:hypothetical protein